MITRTPVAVVVMAATLAAQTPFDAVWVQTSETSAVICWRLGDPAKAARSRVEHGETTRYGKASATSDEPRWIQFHRLRGLRAGCSYHFRLVNIDPETGKETRDEDRVLSTARVAEAIRIDARSEGPPWILDRAGATYLLSEDLSAAGTAIEIRAPDVTIDLDGHTLTYGEESSEQVFGIYVRNEGAAVIRNGHIVQGAQAGPYSSAVESRWRLHPTEISGISTEVHRPCGYPIRLFGIATRARIHHNLLASRVTEIESRHYPGNDLLRLDQIVQSVAVYDNILSGGCHVGIRASGGEKSAERGVEIHHNDIRHHARYVNGYALAVSCPGADIHGNVVTSTGRGVHLTAEGIRFHRNRLDLRGHMTLDDMPQGSRPWKERRVELHGVKLEGEGARRCQVHDNFVRIVQKRPDAEWDYVPATPLNIASYHPDARNEIFGNEFVALTEFHKTRRGGYGDSGQWAAALYFVGMNRGRAPRGGFAVRINDNTFISNDVLVGGRAEGMTILIERNRFRRPKTPPLTRDHAIFHGVGPDLRRTLRRGQNALPAR